MADVMMAAPVLLKSQQGEIIARVNPDTSWSVLWDKVTDQAYASRTDDNGAITAYSQVLLAARDNFLTTDWQDVKPWSLKSISIVNKMPIATDLTLFVIATWNAAIAVVNMDGVWSVDWHEVQDVFDNTTVSELTIPIIGICRLLLGAKDNFLTKPFPEFAILSQKAWCFPAFVYTIIWVQQHQGMNTMPFDGLVDIEDRLKSIAIPKERVLRWRQHMCEKFADRRYARWMSNPAFPLSSFPNIYLSAPKAVKALAKKLSDENPDISCTIHYFDTDPILYVNVGSRRYCVAIWDMGIVRAIAADTPKLSLYQRAMRLIVKTV